MSLTSDALRKLATLSLSSEQMAGVLDILADIQSADEQRKADQRDRVRRHREKHNCNVTETSPERDTPIPDKEKSPTPPKEINLSPTSLRSETKRATRLPDNWALPLPWGQWALDQGFPSNAIRLEADKFADFWRSKGGKDAAKLDWEATWRNWIRNASKPRNFGTPPPAKTAFQQRHQTAIDAFDRKLGLKPNDEFAGSNFDLEPADWRAH